MRRKADINNPNVKVAKFAKAVGTDPADEPVKSSGPEKLLIRKSDV